MCVESKTLNSNGTCDSVHIFIFICNLVCIPSERALLCWLVFRHKIVNNDFNWLAGEHFVQLILNLIPCKTIQAATNTRNSQFMNAVRNLIGCAKNQYALEFGQCVPTRLRLRNELYHVILHCMKWWEQVSIRWLLVCTTFRDQIIDEPRLMLNDGHPTRLHLLILQLLHLLEFISAKSPSSMQTKITEKMKCEFTWIWQRYRHPFASRRRHNGPTHILLVQRINRRLFLAEQIHRTYLRAPSVITRQNAGK